MADNILEFDIEAVCRICLQDSESEMPSIYEKDATDNSTSLLLYEKIERCGGIEIINNPMLPSRICFKCNAFLKVAHKFRVICKHSDNYLREYVYKATPSEDEDGEPEQENTIEEYLVDYSPDEVDGDTETALLEVITEANEQLTQVENNEYADEVQNEDNEEISEINYTEMWLQESAIEHGICVEAQHKATLQMARPKTLDISHDGTIVLRAKQKKADSAMFKTKTDKHVHICDICGNSYPRKYALEAHMRRHRGERPYECEICHAAFHLNFQLTRHIRKHTGDRPYKCQFCERNFADRSTLVKHERIHTNERPYACQTCGKTFTYSSVLKVHLLTHSGEKPYNCGICGKRFARGHHLRAHLETQLHQSDPTAVQLLRELKRDCQD